MTDYIPHEVGRIRRDKALGYYLAYEKHVPMIWLADCHRPHASRLVYSFSALVDFLEAMTGQVKPGAGSKHELGYYKQGVN